MSVSDGAVEAGREAHTTVTRSQQECEQPQVSVSDEAVEAAAQAMYAQDGGDGDFNLEVYEDYAVAMLEAAAPHMLQPAKHEAWDEGFAVGWDCEGDVSDNPYPKPTDAV